MFLFNVIYNNGVIIIRSKGFDDKTIIVTDTMHKLWNGRMTEMVQYYTDHFVKLMWADKMYEIWGEKYLKFIDKFHLIRRVKYVRVE
jgi:hypothetical protein